MKKSERILTVTLNILYVPLSFFSWLMMMAEEMSIVNPVKPLQETLMKISTIISFSIPFICIGAVIAAYFLRNKGHRILSISVHLLPLIIFILNLLLIIFTDYCLAETISCR